MSKKRTTKWSFTRFVFDLFIPKLSPGKYRYFPELDTMTVVENAA